MASEVSEYTTRELSEQTWPDFEKLFETHPGPGAYPCWCMYNDLTRWGSETEYRGTVSMFQKEGFEIVASFGKNNVIMRKTL